MFQLSATYCKANSKRQPRAWVPGALPPLDDVGAVACHRPKKAATFPKSPIWLN